MLEESKRETNIIKWWSRHQSSKLVCKHIHNTILFDMIPTSFYSLGFSSLFKKLEVIYITVYSFLTESGPKCSIWSYGCRKEFYCSIKLFCLILWCRDDELKPCPVNQYKKRQALPIPTLYVIYLEPNYRVV